MITDRGCEKSRLCIVCNNVYPLFDAGVLVPPGGMETRAALFGRGLAASGHWDISFIVSDFGQPFKTRHEDIDFLIYQPTYRQAGRNVFPRLRRSGGSPLLHFDGSDLALCWQVPQIAAWLALPTLCFPRFWRKLNPDVVCCFGNNDRAAEVIADCRRQGIRTILLIASDKDISPDYRPGNRTRNHYGMPKWKGYYALATADQIIVQSEAQRTALLKHFGRDSALIRNPVHISHDDPQHWLPRDKREFVLWIGRTDEFNKRPMLFVELARDCPGLAFLMIVARTNDASFISLVQACPNNLRIVEHVRQHEIWEYLRRARILVNTSRFEGFPNTLLQSAVMGVPIVSLEVDPDGILTNHGCGVCAHGDLRAMREAVLDLCVNVPRADALATTSHRYVLERHGAEGRVAEFETRLRELAGQAAVAARPWWAVLRRFA